MFRFLLKLTTSDPLKRMLIDTPMDILQKGAEDGAQRVARYVLGEAIISAPWHSGMMANAQEVWKPGRLTTRQRERGVLASRKVAVSARKVGREGHYYPLAIEFGWDDKPAGVPWLRESLHRSQGEALRLYRSALTKAVRNGQGVAG